MNFHHFLIFSPITFLRREERMEKSSSSLLSEQKSHIAASTWLHPLAVALQSA
jgi:hypothetical protein